MQPDRPGDELIQQESEDRLANSFTSKYNGNLLMVKRNCDVASDLHWYTWWSALKSRALFKPIRDKHTAVFARFAVATLPRTQTSLFRCARKGRREGDNGRDGAEPTVCTLPMVPCGSSPVTRVSRSPLACEKRSA